MDAHNPKDLQPETMLGMKLIQQPFSKMPSAENLYDFDALKQTRDTVSHHLQFSHLLMIIQGPKGSGKDSLANSLIVSEHPALYFFNATAELNDTAASILNKAANNNNAESTQQLESRISDIMYRGQQPVLIVNDAEQLAEDELRALIKYASLKKDNNQQIQLKLLLLGDLSLEKNLDRYGIINHNQYYMIELPLLNVSNTRSFLMHRLTQAGFRDANPFTDKDITNIYSIANGNPDVTMLYAAELLNQKKSLKDDNLSVEKKAKKPLIFIAAALFLAAIIYNSLILTPTTTPEETSPVEKPMTDQSAVEKLFSAPAGNNTMAVKQQQSAQPLNKLRPEISVPTLGNKTQTADKQITAAEQNIIETNTPAAQTDKPEAVTNGAADTPAPEATPEAAATATDDRPTPAKTQTTSDAKTTLKTETAVLSKPQIKAATETVDQVTQSFIDAGALPPAWLLKQPPERWSLQILGGHQPDTLLSFIRQHRLNKKVAYFRSRLANKDWHVILYGMYPSKAHAKAAIKTLPAFLQQQKPWPKDMKSVQAAIRQHKTAGNK
ncbi:MAG: SPOR domain-containing protein [Gammaproteobacteria bacterium]|nr:SPOR domain-containing protein [Gammaproteobacteria bacterium]